MYNFTINDGKENHTIVEVPDEVGVKLLQDARAASKYAKLYEFAPGDICVYEAHWTHMDIKPEEKYFCLTKVWFEDIGKGFFNAIYLDGDVINSGSLDLIRKVGSMHTPLENFNNFFRAELFGKEVK